MNVEATMKKSHTEMTEKESLRSHILEVRSTLNAEQVIQASDMISLQLKAFKPFQTATNIACYIDFRNEVSTKSLIQWMWKNNKNVFIPLVNFKTKEMTFHQFMDYESLSISKFGILEPNPQVHPVVDATLIDFMICPGVAFTTSGYRMGYGAGFYDRFLSTLIPKPITVGVAFDLQVVHTLPVEPHDMQLDYIITPTQFYKK